MECSKTIPLISVVMPSFNSKRHIEESINSLYEQSNNNWELIVVDGHSTDGTLDIIESYIQKDERIKLVFDNGKGIGEASKIGCSYCVGKYIARMDTDDISMPNRLEEELTYLEKHPKTVMVSSSAIYINENGDIIGCGFPYRHNYGSKYFKKSIFHSSIMMRKDAYEKAGGYFGVRHAEDLFLWYRLQKTGNIKVLSTPLIKYRIAEGALSNYVGDFINIHTHYLWLFYSRKERISENDISYINSLILENRSNTQIERNPVNKTENLLFKILNGFMPKSFALKLMLCLKDVYGVYKAVFYKEIIES